MKQHKIGKIFLIILVISFLLYSFITVFQGFLNLKLSKNSNIETVGLYLNIKRSGKVLNHAGGPPVSTNCFSLIYFTVNGINYETETNFLNIPYGYSLQVRYNKNCPEFNRVIIPDSLLKYQCTTNDCIICFSKEIGKSPENYIKLGNALPFNWVYLFYD